MSTLTDPPKAAFRPSQLIYDTRYRSITIQVVALILLCIAFYWLINNTVQNLANLGKEFNFSFLGSRAGYDINQRPIAYDNSMTHARAALVGMTNTILVSALGCIMATIIGVIIGVLRLSNNWVVSRLAAVYVEGFRNVPLLLWIIAIFALFTEGMDPPNTFRPNADGIVQNEMFLGSVAVTNQGTFMPGLAWSSLAWILSLVLIACIAGIVFLRRRARAIQAETGRIVPVFLPALGVLIVPMVLGYFALSAVSQRNDQVFVALGAQSGMDLASYAEASGRINFCSIPSEASTINAERYMQSTEVNFRRGDFFGDDDARKALAAGNCSLIIVDASEADALIAEIEATPLFNEPIAVLSDQLVEGRVVEVHYPVMTERGIPRFEGGFQVRNPLIALWLALSLYTGAFIAEIVRAGILAVSRGQSEAAFALGLRPNRTMRLVILPQALRVIVPPLISQFLNLTKNSSLAIAVGYMDVRATLGGITINQTGRELEGILLMGMFYLALSIAISAVMNFYNNRNTLKER